MPKKAIHVDNVEANTQGPHVKRVPKKISYFVGTNTKKGSTESLKEKTSKVHNSRRNTKSLTKGNNSQVFYSKRKREVAYKKNKKRRHMGNHSSTVEERRKSNECIPHPHFNNKPFFTYNEHNGKITWAKVPNR